jgi:YVTN family beta-propeller protein
VIATIPGGGSPAGIAVTPDGTRAYVTNFVSNSVSVIETATNAVTATIRVGVEPYYGVAITPDGTRAYVTNEGSNSVSVIKTATNKVVKTIPVGIVPAGIAITSDGSRAYVANEGFSDFVSVIDIKANTVVATIPVGVNPFGVAITPVQAPTSKEQCKNGGYKKFGSPAGPFKNQGQCVSYVEHH